MAAKCTAILCLLPCLSAMHAAWAPQASAAQAPARSLGPYVWRSVEIHGGGFVTGIIMHPAAKGVMYARTDIGGAYRWDPRTERWVALLDWAPAADWNLYGVESVAVDPSDPARVYIACGTYTNDWSGNGAILRSADQGRTWQRTGMPFKMGGNEPGRSCGERLAVGPNDGRVLYFGSRLDGLWRSADRGASWQKVQAFAAPAAPEPAPPQAAQTPEEARRARMQWARKPVGIVFVVFDKASGPAGAPTPTIYAGVSAPDAHLYRSTDAGATWQALAGQPKGFVPHHAVLSPSGIMYITYGNGPGPNDVTDGAVRKLDPKAQAWTDITPLRPGPGDTFGYAGLSVDAQRPDTVMVTTLDRWSKVDEVFRSTDGGAHWKGLRELSVRDSSASPYLKWGRPQADIGHWMGDLEIDPHSSDHVLYVTGAGIWRSLDATEADSGRPTHRKVGSCGLEETVILGLISPPAGAPLLSVMGDLGGFRHVDLNVSPPDGFFQPFHGTNNGIDFAEQNPDIVVRRHGGTGGSYSLDNGRTWTEFPGELQTERRGGGLVAVSADGGTWVRIDMRQAPQYTRDRAATWTPCAGLAPGMVVLSDRSNPNKFYAVQFRGTGFMVSADGAAAFTSAAALPDVGGDLRAVPGHEGRLWLATESGLYRSTDSGASFARVAGVDGARRVSFGRAAAGWDYPAVYIAGTVAGVYGFFRSDDEGAAWVRINDDEHQYGDIGGIAGDPRVYGRLYVGTSHRGIIYGEPAGG